MLQVLRYVALLTLLMNFLTLPAGALTPLPPTVSKGVAPNWTPAPGSPGVEYAPNLKVDLFRHQGLYYYWVAGGWQVGQSPSGPWRSLKQVPWAIQSLDSKLFKSIYKPGSVPPPRR